MRKEPEKLRVGRGRDWLSREFRGQSQNIPIFNPDGREDLGSPIHPAHGWNTQSSAEIRQSLLGSNFFFF